MNALKPYLARSTGAHLLAGVLIAWAAGRAVGPKATQIYTIDFVGPSATIISQPSGPSAAQAGGPSLPAAKPQQQTELDEFARGRRRPNAPLPKPSLLRGWREPAPDEAPAQPAQSPAAGVPQAAASTGGEGAPGDAGVATDLPNFPYPWYISQVRSALWGQWSSRMPRQGGQAIVVFTIMPNGSVVDVRTEETSGDAAFDLVALSAVQDSAPFPPLPRGFPEPFLKVHVTLKAN